MKLPRTATLKVILSAQREAVRRGYELVPMPQDGLIRADDPPGLYLNVNQYDGEVYLYSVNAQRDDDNFAGLFPGFTFRKSQHLASYEDATIVLPGTVGYIFDLIEQSEDSP